MFGQRRVAAPRGAGFWTAEVLLERQTAAAKDNRPIISNFVTERLERISYNLTVGDEIFISPSGEDDPKTRRILKDREACVIPPGQFALLTTAETIRVPTDVIAFISLRSKPTKFKGLVNVSGFYVEPGYDGILIFTVFNAGPAAIHVARGDPWFEIFFADLSNPSIERRKKDYFQGIDTSLIAPLSYEFLSLPALDKKIKATSEDLDERIRSIEREHGIGRWSMALILGGLIALGVRQCSLDRPNAPPSESSTTPVGTP